jgi:hypothetical protein
MLAKANYQTIFCSDSMIHLSSCTCPSTHLCTIYNDILYVVTGGKTKDADKSLEFLCAPVVFK